MLIVFTKLRWFNQQYLGRWYEYSNYFAIFQLFGICVTADYTDESSAGRVQIGVLNRGINRM